MSKSGIKYYSMDTDSVINKRIKLLFSEFDSHGPWVWLCLLHKIYFENGYYYDTSDRDEFILFAQDVCKKQVHLVDEIIKGCIRRGLFDESVFNTFNILTSDRIQQNYIDATKDRRNKGAIIEIHHDLLLIDIPEKEKNISIIREKINFSQEKMDISKEKLKISTEKPLQSKVKEKKGKESKVKEKNTPEISDEIPGGKSDKNFIDEILNIFCEEYQKSRGFAFEIPYPGKEKDAIGKIVKLYRKNNPDANTEKALKDLRRYFERVLAIPEKEESWHYQSMSPAHIASKHNDLRIILERRKNGSADRFDAQPRSF